MRSPKHPWRPLFANQGTVLDLLAIAILWAVAIGLVNPVGDFPLNDDWAYATNVKRFLEEGKLITIGWIAPPIFGHALYGGLFCSLFGFSFTVLRFSTLLMGLFGAGGTYLLVRQLDATRGFALTTALVLAFNPLYFSLSYTFMTDVPFTAISVWAMLFMLRSLLYETDMDFILGSCLAVVAILYRQIGIFIPLAFALAILVKPGRDVKWLLRAGCLVVVGVALLIGMKTFLNLTAPHNLRWEESLTRLQHPERVLKRIFVIAFVAWLYIGLFLFPLAIQLVKFNRRTRVWPVGLFLICVAVLSAPLIYIGSLMPISRHEQGSILTESGVGPVLLRDTYILLLPHVPPLPHWFFVVTTIVSILGAAILLTWLALAFLNAFSNGRRVLTFIGEENHRMASFFSFPLREFACCPWRRRTPSSIAMSSHCCRWLAQRSLHLHGNQPRSHAGSLPW
jgi:hypothetical protein